MSSTQPTSTADTPAPSAPADEPPVTMTEFDDTSYAIYAPDDYPM